MEEKINLMLKDPKYATRAKEIGALTVDQIQHPLQRATWWLEHIMRHSHEYRNKSPVLNIAGVMLDYLEMPVSIKDKESNYEILYF